MNNQQLKIEVFKEGETAPTTATGNYTVESNYLPKMEAIDLTNLFYRMSVQNSLLTPWANPMFSVFGKEPCCIEWGAVALLGDEKFKDAAILREFLDKDTFIGRADVNNEYIGSNQQTGTVNKKETKYDKSDGMAHKYHIVFDFPTHAANNKEITEVDWFPYAFTTAPDSRNYTEILGKRYVTPFVHDQQLVLGGFDSGYTDFVKSPTGDLIVWCNDTVWGNIGGKVVQMFFAEPELSTTGNIIRIGAWINGAFHFAKKASSSNNPYIYRCTGITWDEARSMHKIATEAVMPPYVDINGRSKIIEFMFEWENHAFIAILEGDGYSSGSGESLKVFKFDKTLTNKVLDGRIDKYSDDYYSQQYGSLPVIYHEEAENRIYVTGNHRQVCSFNTSLEFNLIGKYYTDYSSYGASKYKKLPGIKPYGGMCINQPLNSYASPSGTYAFGDCDLFGNPVFKFKLSSPIVKKADETLKLTFDITIKNGNVYES